MNEAHLTHQPIFENESEKWNWLVEQCRIVTDGESNLVANCANVSSLLYHTLAKVNWCGFYFVENRDLVLGPFQGKPACVRIQRGKGVCGTALQESATIVVQDVHEFPGHIACDAASRSEIVVPVFLGDSVIGLLDIDSPIVHRFSQMDAVYLEKICTLVAERLL